MQSILQLDLYRTPRIVGSNLHAGDLVRFESLSDEIIFHVALGNFKTLQVDQVKVSHVEL